MRKAHGVDDQHRRIRGRRNGPRVDCCTAATCVAIPRRGSRHGLTLLELLAVVLLLGILSAVVIVRFLGPSDTAKRNACYVFQGEIELQAQLWFRNTGTWPDANLTAIGSDPAYFPSGLPLCPVDGSAYTFDPATQRVVGHVH